MGKETGVSVSSTAWIWGRICAVLGSGQEGRHHAPFCSCLWCAGILARVRAPGCTGNACSLHTPSTPSLVLWRHSSCVRQQCLCSLSGTFRVFLLFHYLLFFCLMQMHGTVLQICIRSSFCWCFCCLVRSACLLCWTLEVQCKCISRPHSKTSSSCSHFVRALKMCRTSLGRCSVSWTTIWWLICWVFRLTDQACSVSFGSVHWLDFLFCAWRVPRANDIAVR